MPRIIGPAHEFYRLRITKVDEAEEPDLEWREDILYRTPPVQPAEVREGWILEAVTLSEEETVIRIGWYGDSEEVRDAMDMVAEALGELSKSQFEERFFDLEDDGLTAD